jgi:branched-chain amino acid transport system ATP-binding protein
MWAALLVTREMGTGATERLGGRMTLSATDVTIRFGGVIAVNQMAIVVQPGEIVGLIGPNGAGKTTFINCICGSYQPSMGSVRWKDKELLGLSPNMLLRLGISRTFQNVASLHDLTVMDLVKLGAGMSRQRPGFRGRFGASKALEGELTETLLSPLGLESYAHQPIQTLPYGRRKATDLARALAANPKLLLLDEPVAGLTTQEAMAMAGVIRRVREQLGCAVMMVEHKMDVVLNTCDRIVVMAAGSKIFEGSGTEVQSDAEVRRVYLGEP